MHNVGWGMGLVALASATIGLGCSEPQDLSEGTFYFCAARRENGTCPPATSPGGPTFPDLTPEVHMTLLVRSAPGAATVRVVHRSYRDRQSAPSRNDEQTVPWGESPWEGLSMISATIARPEQGWSPVNAVDVWNGESEIDGALGNFNIEVAAP